MTDLLSQARQAVQNPESIWPRVEFVDGGVLVTPAAGLEHAQACSDVYDALRDVAPPSVRVRQGVNVVCSADTLVVPDVLVYDAAQPPQGLGVAPEHVRLVVEVLSPSTARIDRSLKRDLYSSLGIGYWIVDPAARTVEQVGTPDAWVVVPDGYTLT